MACLLNQQSVTVSRSLLESGSNKKSFYYKSSTLPNRQRVDKESQLKQMIRYTGNSLVKARIKTVALVVLNILPGVVGGCGLKVPSERNQQTMECLLNLSIKLISKRCLRNKKLLYLSKGKTLPSTATI